MKIKAEAYRLVNTDLVVSESEAELEDKELEIEELAPFRTEKLARLYIKKKQKEVPRTHQDQRYPSIHDW